MTNNHTPFDRRLVRLHRDRARLDGADFLFTEMAGRLAERLADMTRTFPTALDLGAHTGQLASALKGIGGIETLVQADLSFRMIQKAPGLKIIADEEFLPFAENSFDLIVSAGSLHWVNDLPGALVQIRRALKPGGLFLATLPGGQTLAELRHAFAEAEISHKSGASPRVSPMLDVREAGGLLQRAGFSMPVADSESLTVSYTHPLKLLHDLRAMGEGNALIERAKHFTSCSLMMSMADHYLREFSGDDARICATFELVTLTGVK